MIFFIDIRPDYVCCAKHLISIQPDFKEQKTAINEAVEAQGFLFELFPKYHCETNYIERYWGAAKRMARDQCDYSFKSLEKNVPKILDNISLSKIRKFTRKAWRYIEAYSKDCDGLNAERLVKKFKSHRRILTDD